MKLGAQVAWLTALAIHLSAGVAPNCRYVPRSSRIGSAEAQDGVFCTCRGVEQPVYEGNLNFLKSTLMAVPSDRRLVDVVISNCTLLSMELNLHTLYVSTGLAINLRILDTGEVNIGDIRLPPIADRPQVVILLRVATFHLEGPVVCPNCSNNVGINFKLERMEKVRLSGMRLEAPLQLSGRYIASLTIQHSYFDTLPWPGIFLYKTESISITNNTFHHSLPRSLDINDGKEVLITHNIFNVTDAVKVSQYSHVTIRCNRKSAAEPLPADCSEPREERRSSDATALMTITRPPPPEVETILESSSGGGGGDLWSAWTWDQFSAALLTIADAIGLVLLSLALLLTSLILLVYLCWGCICSSNRDGDGSDEKTFKNGSNPNEVRGIADLIKATSSLGARLVDVEGGGLATVREADEYSNSSRAHLAQGVEPGPLQYIRVQGVTTEEEEEGVVCGHLTLGPSFTVGDSASMRTASSNRLKQQTFSRV